MNELEQKNRTSLPTDSKQSQTPTMYLVRLRAHLSRGKIALGEALDAVTEVLPLPRKGRR